MVPLTYNREISHSGSTGVGASGGILYVAPPKKVITPTKGKVVVTPKKNPVSVGKPGQGQVTVKPPAKITPKAVQPVPVITPSIASADGATSATVTADPSSVLGVDPVDGVTPTIFGIDWYWIAGVALLAVYLMTRGKR